LPGGEGGRYHPDRNRLGREDTGLDTRELRSLLDRIGAIRRPCDLDLLVFFYRHPRALLTAEQIVGYLGRDREEVAKSLEDLIEAGLVTRSHNQSRTARLYVLELDALPGGLLTTFLEIAISRQGRHDLMQLLEPEPDPTKVA
jgi:DNA-binding MarR family transcriptional regulator